MMLILMLALALALSLPLLLVFRRGKNLPERREASVALHRAQLEELNRDLADGRIGRDEHAGAKLEVERRILAADAMPAQPSGGSAKLLLLMTLIALPIGGFALYLPDATPVPSEPHAAWAAQQAVQFQQLNKLITMLRAHLAVAVPGSADASEGEAYLAEALSEQAGTITPEALALFKQSFASAPANSSWRQLDQERLMQVQGGQ
ncbi:MAG: c-type cytochrome biogenesis protein CcmI [Rhodospirillales bacterium]|nr:c-type cytochrome biogenesis protein CcmI [Rhodospirillales bacterium]